MTDRINAITVVLENDIRDDDAETILTAIRMVRGVLSATPNVSELSDHIAQERVRRELGDKILEVLHE